MNFDKDPGQLVGRLKEVYYIYKTLNEQNKHKMVEIPIFKKQ